MAIIDIFKKKKIEEKEVKPKEKPIEVEPRTAEVRSQTKEPQPSKLKRGARIGDSQQILKSPHITEKATDLAGKNQYIFKIWPRANKTEVKKAVEEVFGVSVFSVKIINVHKKKRRLGKIKGFRKGYKKAVVKIKKGQKIEVLAR